MATVPAVFADKEAHSPLQNTATDPPPGDTSYFTAAHHRSDPSTPVGAHTPSGTHTPRRASDSSIPSTPTGTSKVDYNTTAATPDDVDIPGLLFAIPYPTPLNASPKKDRPSFLLYAPPRAAYRRPPETPDGKKGKEKLVKRIERNWQEEVGQGKKIGKGELPDATKWQKTKGLFTRKASQAIQWLPDSNIEALSRVPPKSKMHQVRVFIPEDSTTNEIQTATGGHVASRLELERQLQAARSKAIKRSAISGALLPVTGVIDVLCPIPIFAFEIDAAYFTSQYQGLKKATAMTSDVRLALEPTPHLGALSERLLQICYKLSPKQFPVPQSLEQRIIPGSPMGMLSPVDTGTPAAESPAYLPALPPRPGQEGASGISQEKNLKQATTQDEGWYPEDRYASFDSKYTGDNEGPNFPVATTSAVPPPLPPRPSPASASGGPYPSAEEEKRTLGDQAHAIEADEHPPSYTPEPTPSTAPTDTKASLAPPPLPPRPPTSAPAIPSTISLAPTSATDPFTDSHIPADGASTRTNPFGSPDPADACSVVYTDTLGGSKPNTAPNTPAVSWTDPAPLSGGVTRVPSRVDSPPPVSAPAGTTHARAAPPRGPDLPTAARALAEAVIKQVRAAVPPAVAERHALDDVGELARDIERCLEKGAKEFVKTL